MKQCKSCLAKAEPQNGRCPVCGIDPDKKRGALSSLEKSVRLHARGIRLLAMLHLIGVAMMILWMPDLPAPFAIAILAAVNAFLAYGLSRFSLLAYKAAVTYYFLIGMVNVISIQHGPEHLGGIALALGALYLVGTRTAKAIFERTLPA